jgi:hypothetical protein
VFFEERGRIVMENAAMLTIREAQEACTGEAERLELETEEDVVRMVKEARSEIGSGSQARRASYQRIRVRTGIRGLGHEQGDCQSDYRALKQM